MYFSKVCEYVFMGSVCMVSCYDFYVSVDVSASDVL